MQNFQLSGDAPIDNISGNLKSKQIIRFGIDRFFTYLSSNSNSIVAELFSIQFCALPQDGHV